MAKQIPVNFGKRVIMAGGCLLKELTEDPDAPPTNCCIIYAKDNGAGKTGLYARFATGAVQQAAIEP